VLPRLPLSLPHPAANIGPRCCSAPSVSHAAPCHPRPAALPCSPARLRHERTMLPLTTPPRAILASRSGCRSRPPLSLFLSPPRGTPELTPTHFPLCSPQALTELKKPPVPHSTLRSCPSLSSPPSPPPTHPPHGLPPPETSSTSLVSVRAPLPPPLHSETLPSAIVVLI
jgi:hypothetical protein